MSYSVVSDGLRKKYSVLSLGKEKRQAIAFSKGAIRPLLHKRAGRKICTANEHIILSIYKPDRLHRLLLREAKERLPIPSHQSGPSKAPLTCAAGLIVEVSIVAADVLLNAGRIC